MYIDSKKNKQTFASIKQVNTHLLKSVFGVLKQSFSVFLKPGFHGKEVKLLPFNF